MIITISEVIKNYFIAVFFKKRNSSKICPMFVTYLDEVCPFSLFPQCLLTDLV